MTTTLTDCERKGKTNERRLCSVIIFTHSCDGTTDLLLQYVSNPERILRFNLDLFSAYRVDITPFDFAIEDETGRCATFASTKKGYFRKPSLASHPPGEERYTQREEWTAYRAIIQMLWQEERMVLVEPFVEKGRLNKFHQIKIAQKYFAVETVRFTNRTETTHGSGLIVKSLNGGNLDGKTLYSIEVDPALLHPRQPWLLQKKIAAQFDITVVYVRGDCFSFRFERAALPEGIIDYRSQMESWDNWERIDLPVATLSKIRLFMKEVDLEFGRLDFLQTPEGELYFLEVNPNGQFAWLDGTNKAGLLSRIASEIS